MAAVSTRTSIEVLRFPVESSRARHVLDAIVQALGGNPACRSIRTHVFRGGAQWLVLWGAGAPDRRDPIEQQLSAGGHVLACDLGYWDRDRSFRVSIDAPHPQAWVLRKDWPVTRWRAAGLAVEQAWVPAGPVLIAGIGAKARTQYGSRVAEWEAACIRAARALGREVWYRPKKDGPVPSGVKAAPPGPIEAVLRRVSLVCTWHSNVGVDAIRMGIPVVCQDGAAAAVCPSDLCADPPAPLSPSVRDRFLANLAWFQWRPKESAQLLAWLPTVLA